MSGPRPPDSTTDPPLASRHSPSMHSSPRSSPPATPHARLHVPQTPSRLRHSHAPGSPSPEDADLREGITGSPLPTGDGAQDSLFNSMSENPPIDFEEDGLYPQVRSGTAPTESLEATHRTRGQIVEEHNHAAASVTTRLLESYHRKQPSCDDSQCDHGTFTPSYAESSSGGRDDSGFGGPNRDEEMRDGERGDLTHRLLGDAITDGLLGGSSRPKHRRWESWVSWSSGNGKGMSTTAWLAETHGIKGKKKMFLNYYITFFKCASLRSSTVFQEAC